MSNLETEFYKAKSGGDAAAYEKAKADCLLAGYIVDDGCLSATAKVANAPALPENAKQRFEASHEIKGGKVTKKAAS